MRGEAKLADALQRSGLPLAVRVRVALDVLAEIERDGGAILIPRSPASRLRLDNVTVSANGVARLSGGGDTSGVAELAWEVVAGKPLSPGVPPPVATAATDVPPPIARIVDDAMTRSGGIASASDLLHALAGYSDVAGSDDVRAALGFDPNRRDRPSSLFPEADALDAAVDTAFETMTSRPPAPAPDAGGSDERARAADDDLLAALPKLAAPTVDESGDRPSQRPRAALRRSRPPKWRRQDLLEATPPDEPRPKLDSDTAQYDLPPDTAARKLFDMFDEPTVPTPPPSPETPERADAPVPPRPVPVPAAGAPPPPPGAPAPPRAAVPPAPPIAAAPAPSPFGSVPPPRAAPTPNVGPYSHELEPTTPPNAWRGRVFAVVVVLALGGAGLAMFFALRAPTVAPSPFPTTEVRPAPPPSSAPVPAPPTTATAATTTEPVRATASASAPRPPTPPKGKGKGR